MKSYIRFAIVALVLCTPVVAVASSDGGTGMSQEDAEKLRSQVNALGQLFNVPQAKPAAGQEHKTPADVADKALTLFSGAVAQVAQSIEKVAPELFRVMVRQQYAKAATNIIAPFGAIFITLIAGWSLRRVWKVTEDDRNNEEYVFHIIIARIAPVVLALIFGIWFVDNLSDSAGLLLNPEFYAVKDLVMMVLNPSSLQ